MASIGPNRTEGRREYRIVAVVAGLLLTSCSLPFTEPPDYAPQIQNQLDEIVEIFEHPFEAPDQTVLLIQLEPWQTYRFESLTCTGKGLVAIANEAEVARIDNGYGLCDGDVWKIRASSSIVGDNGRLDERP